MDRTRPWTRALAGVCALTLLFAACGDDEDDGGDASDDTEQTTEAADETTESTEAPDESTESQPEDETTTSEATEGDPEAVATAESINLKLEDFADGWVEEEPAEDGGDDIDQCFTTVDIGGTTLGEAETPTFTAETADGEGGQLVSMQTIVFDTPETATAVVAEVGTPEFAACIQGTITDDGDGADAALAPIVDDPPVGEESAGVAGAVAVPAAEGTKPAQADLHVIRTGAIASFTITLDVGETPDTAFQQTLAELYTLIAERQAEAA